MVIKNTTLLLIVLLTLASAKFRISQDLSTLNVIEQILVLPDNTLAVSYRDVIQIINESDYQTVIQQIQTKGLVSDLFLSQINGALVFLQSGSINSVTKKQQDLSQYVSSVFAYYQTQMKIWNDTIIVPPLDVYNLGLKINISNFNINLITTSDSYTLQAQPYGGSNIYIDNSTSSYYFMTVDNDLNGQLNVGNLNSYSNIYNFTNNINRAPSEQVRSLASLDGFNVSGQKYIGLIWQPQGIGLQYDLIRQVNISKFENYSSTVALTRTRTAKFIDYNSILVYDTSCQIVKVNPINPVALNAGVTGFDSSFQVTSVSEKQDMIFGLNNPQTNGFYTSSYLYTLNQNGEFILNVTLNNSTTGNSFGSSSFILNDSYLVVLQLQSNNTNTTNTQLSLYSLIDQTFKDSQRILNVYSVNQTGYFCSCLNSSRLFVIGYGDNQTATLSWYNLQNGSLVLKDNITLNILVTQITNFNCLGGDSFIIMSSLPNITFTKYSININNIIIQAATILIQVQDYYKLAVMDNLIVVSPIKLLTNSTILFYDWNLVSVNLTFNNSQFIYTISILACDTNTILLQKSDSSIELWSLSNQQLTYTGGIPSQIYNKKQNSMVYYFQILLLPRQNTLYIEYVGTPTNIAYNYKLDNLPNKRLGEILDSENSCPSLAYTKFITISNNTYLIGYDLNSESTMKYSIQNNGVTLVDTFTNDIETPNIRLSSNNQWLILWGNDIQTSDQRLQIRNIDRLTTIKYDRTFPDFAAEPIYDVDYTNNDQIVLTTSEFIFFNVYQLQNNEQVVESTTQLSSITVFTTGINLVAYSGIDSTSGVSATYFVFHPINNVVSITTVQVGCPIKLLQFSPAESSIVGVCLNNTLFYYIILLNSTTTFALGGVSTKISFLNESSVTVTLDGKIVIKNLQPSSSMTHKQLKAAAANSSVAIDYKTQQIAYSSNSTNIVITDFNGAIIDQVQLPSTGNVVALAFNANDELLVSTDTPNLFIWTTLPCQQNFTLNNQFCTCSDTYVPVDNNLCACPNDRIVVNNLCGCSNGYVLQSNNCQKCSLMCDTCDGSGLLSCSTYGAWFYVILVGLILIVAGIIFAIVVKVRKNRKLNNNQSEPLNDDKSKGMLDQQ